MTLIDKVLFLEIQIRHKDGIQPLVPFKVKEAVKESLVKICSWFKFCNSEISFGFLCKECQGRERHMAKYSVNYEICECHFKKATLVTDSHRIWFEKVRIIEYCKHLPINYRHLFVCFNYIHEIKF